MKIERAHAFLAGAVVIAIASGALSSHLRASHERSKNEVSASAEVLNHSLSGDRYEILLKDRIASHKAMFDDLIYEIKHADASSDLQSLTQSLVIWGGAYEKSKLQLADYQKTGAFVSIDEANRESLHYGSEIMPRVTAANHQTIIMLMTRRNPDAALVLAYDRHPAQVRAIAEFEQWQAENCKTGDYFAGQGICGDVLDTSSTKSQRQSPAANSPTSGPESSRPDFG